MSRVGHCIDNGPTEGLWGIIKSEMYCMYKITDEVSLRSAIDKYIKFYAEERLQESKLGAFFVSEIPALERAVTL